MVVTLRSATTKHDDTPHTVLCGFDCGYLADSEPDLNSHEAGCDRRDEFDQIGGEQS